MGRASLPVPKIVGLFWGGATLDALGLETCCEGCAMIGGAVCVWVWMGEVLIGAGEVDLVAVSGGGWF